jgi:hypothetical protein
VGNPVVLFSAGQDYTGIDVDPVGPCNPQDTLQLVLEATLFSPGGELMLDLAASSTPFLSAQLTTTWTSSDPGVVSVSADGLLQAEGENACATISWMLASTSPAVVVVPLARQSGAIVACVDSGGVDSVTRATWLPVGDVDANIPGGPSGAPFPGIGQEFGVTLIANSGAYGVGAYAATMLNDENVFVTTWTDLNGVGGSTQPGLGLPFAVGGGPRPWRRVWNDVDAFATTSGIFDLATVNYQVVGPGTGFVEYRNAEFADGMACNIWVRNPCMPFSSHVCPVPPPPGGYITIAGAGTATVP